MEGLCVWGMFAQNNLKGVVEERVVCAGLFLEAGMQEKRDGDGSPQYPPVHLDDIINLRQ